MDYSVRNIRKDDNPVLARIIRQTLEEFGAVKPDTVYYDKTTDALYESFQKERSFFFVIEWNDEIVGSGGIYPTEGLPLDTCELVKMYLVPKARGMGLGKMMLEKCEQKARELGYTKIYLESMPELTLALNMYKRSGYTDIGGPMGKSGHCGCSIWMMKELAPL